MYREHVNGIYALKIVYENIENVPYAVLVNVIASS
jgi:hypothetical protein